MGQKAVNLFYLSSGRHSGLPYEG